MTSPGPGYSPGIWPAAGSKDIPVLRRDGWVMWEGYEPLADDLARHCHVYRARQFTHSHHDGILPHDHLPPGGLSDG